MNAHLTQIRSILWRRRSVAVVAVAAGIAVAIVATPTSTAIISPGITGYQVITGTAASLDGAGSQVTVTAACPTGQVAVSGGVSSHSPLGEILSSYPADNFDWTDVVYQADTVGYPGTVTPYVVCVDSSSVPGFHIATGLQNMGPATEGIVNAFCTTGTGEEVLSGGWSNTSVDAPGNISQPLSGDSRAWQVGNYNASATDGDIMTAYATCVPTGDVSGYLQQAGPTIQYMTQNSSDFSGLPSGDVYDTYGAPYCSGELAIGGGAMNHESSSAGAFISSLIPAPGGDPHYWLQTSTNVNPPMYGSWANANDVCVNGTVEPPPPPCTTTITGAHGSVTATSGLTCITNAHITGGVTVTSHASLDIENSTVSGGIAASQSGSIRICHSTVGAPAITHASGFVMIGDPSVGCAGNTINGSVVATSNSGGGAVEGNHITGSTLVMSNAPSWTVSGNT